MSGGLTDRPPLSPPERLATDHVLDGFSSGVASLDDWLIRHARRNELEGASRSYVLCEPSRRVIGYYSLAAGSILHNLATGKPRRNMPNPIPVVLLGRLAIDRAWHGKGLGADLLRDAVLRTVGAAGTIGVRAMLVHAISDEARMFYEKYGFRASTIEPMTLMITVEEALKILGAK